MALYSYQAFSKEGKKITGVIDAPSSAAVKEMLVKQGAYPVHIAPAREGQGRGFLTKLFQRGVSVKEKILFTQQLSTLLKSGVPLVDALELLVDHFESGLHDILITLKDDIKEGTAFADALKKYPSVFPNIYVQLVRAGEASGKLEVILDRLTEYMERREAIRKRIVAAMTYPVIQLALAIAVVIGLVQFVVPAMVEDLLESGKQLPGITQFMVDTSAFLGNYFYYIIVGLVISMIAFSYWKSTKGGARTLDKIKLRLPLVKYFSKTGAVVQFSRTLGMLTESGVNLSESLDIVCSIIDNQVLADALNEARDKIIKQGKIAQYLKQTNIFPPIAIYLIKTGEESGNLGQMLLTVAKNYEEELGEYADGLSSKIGPVMLIVMGVLVGTIVVSIVLPMLDMANISELTEGAKVEKY